MTIALNLKEDVYKRFREGRHGQTMDDYITRLLDAADSQMSEFEKETLRLLQEKQKKLEARTKR